VRVPVIGEPTTVLPVRQTEMAENHCKKYDVVFCHDDVCHRSEPSGFTEEDKVKVVPALN
jgi:hypothetical protein